MSDSTRSPERKLFLRGCALAFIAWLSFGNVAWSFEVAEPRDRADLVYTYSDTICELLGFLGIDPCHTGVYVGSNTVIEAGLSYGSSVASTTLAEYESRGAGTAGLNGVPAGFRGSKVTTTVPSSAQRNQIVAYVQAKAARFTTYDLDHLNQKGGYGGLCFYGNPLCWDGFDYYNEFDCVGLAEKAYEVAGLDPVPSEGIFLTPSGQYFSSSVTQPSMEVGNGAGFSTSVKSKYWDFFYVVVPPGIASLSVSTAGNGGDVDLYVRNGFFPTESEYDCKQVSIGANEVCALSNPSAGTYGIGVFGYDYSGAAPGSGVVNYSLVASYTGPVIPSSTPTRTPTRTPTPIGTMTPSHTVTIQSGPGGNPNPVQPGAVVNLSVSASDSSGLPVTYAWSAGCSVTGVYPTFSNPNLQNPTWTAPSNPIAGQNCTICVIATAEDKSDAGCYTQTVASSQGSTTTPTRTPTQTPTPPDTVGMSVQPNDTWEIVGYPGGPFGNSNRDYTILKTGDPSATLSFSFNANSWLNPSSGSGTFYTGTETTFAFYLGGPAYSFPPGVYTTSITFTNDTNHLGDTTRTVRLTVRDPDDVCILDEYPRSGDWIKVGDRLVFRTNLGGNLANYDLFDLATKTVIRSISSVSGDFDADATYLVVGDGNDGTGGTEAGAVYLYEWATGSRVRKILNPTPIAKDHFGNAVFLNGGRLFAEAANKIGDHSANDLSGKVHVFTVPSGALVSTIQNPQPTFADYFGNDMAATGNSLFVGVKGEDGGPGVVYQFNATTLAYVRTLDNPNPALEGGSDGFGDVVYAADNWLIVGAWGEDLGCQSCGALYAYNATTGALVHTFQNPMLSFNAFGNGRRTIAVSGDMLLAGAPSQQGAGVLLGSGMAFVFNLATGGQIGTFPNPVPAFDVQFGSEVAFNNDHFLVGRNDKIYELDFGVCDMPTPTVTPTNSPSATISPTTSPTSSPPPNTITITVTPTVTHTPTRTNTPTQTPTNTPSPTFTPTATGTSTPTQTPTQASTPTSTSTNTSTATPTWTLSPTSTSASTPTPTATPTATAPGTSAPTYTATPSPTWTPTSTATATFTATTPAPTPAGCTGDCNADNHVTVDEILTMVNVALGNTPLLNCEAGDANHDGQITVDEILTAVNNALNGCPVHISGAIRYYSNGIPVPGVVVELVESTGATTLSAQTDANGQFAFDAVSAGSWQVEPLKSGDLGNAINIQDAVAILQSVVGALTLNAQQDMACDVNGDGTVDNVDAVLIMQYTVGNLTRFPAASLCGSDWIFVPVPSAAGNESVTQPLISGGTCQPGSITFDPISAEAANQDFEAILIGDCNLSWPSEGAPTPAAGG